jgi:hypothetical protein
MTEAEWIACEDTEQILYTSISTRKMRLFLCGCCRHIDHVLPAKFRSTLLELAEECADEPAKEQQLADVLRELTITNLDQWHLPCIDANDIPHAHRAACHAFQELQGPPFQHNAEDCTAGVRMVLSSLQTEPWILNSGVVSAVQCGIFRDVAGPFAFRTVPIERTWRTTNVDALAESIYADRAFERLPILADALEDAGCDNADILNHCRRPGEHVRGCWVVDLVLGKE